MSDDAAKDALHAACMKLASTLLSQSGSDIDEIAALCNELYHAAQRVLEHTPTDITHRRKLEKKRGTDSCRCCLFHR